jgi:hypothetical protein
MAGKTKKKADDAPQSKTARASLRTGGGREAYIASGEVSRIVPLGGGTHAYVLDPRDGKTIRVQVSSDRFVEVLSALVDAGHGDRVNRDLNDLAQRYPEGAWKEAAERLEAARNPAEEAAA